MNLIIISIILFFAVYSVINYKFKLYNKIYDSKNIIHNIVLCAVPLLCGIISFMIFGFLSTKSLEYPYVNSLFSRNAYEQMFDAFMKHQLNIDITPDPLLKQLINPYDWGERQEYIFPYLWDRVYFNDKYYSYFGIAPLLIIYFPFYFLTKKVPTAPTVCFILSLIAIIAIFFLVIKLHKIFLKKVNLTLLVFSILAAETGSLIFMSQASADFYYIAVSSGLAFLALFLLFSFCAYDSDRLKNKCLWFALSGISLVLLVMSRPNLALYFVIIIPIYVSVLFSKEFKISEKVKQVISFAIPTIIGAAFVMWYNYARFGSILEFGAKYQLTVYDVSKYSFSTSLVLPAFYYYFFQFPEFAKSAPYLDIPFYRHPSLLEFPSYVYVTSTIGVLSFPSVWGVACIPASLADKNTDKTKKSVLMLSVVSVIIMSIFDMCFAGVNIRYLADIALICVLFTSVMLCEFVDLFKECPDQLKFAIHSIASALLILSFVLGIGLIFSNERNNLINLPQINY